MTGIVYTSGSSAATTQVVWKVWTAATASSGTTWNESLDDTWTTWNVATTASTTASNVTTWGSWNVAYRASSAPTPRKETAAERQARIDRETAARLEREQKEKQAKAYRLTARRLLLHQLTEQQRKEYEAKGKFHVISQTGKRYEIDCNHDKTQHNVFELDGKGRRRVEYCITHFGKFPAPDTHLAQKLLLEHDEAEFMRIANKRQLQVG